MNENLDASVPFLVTPKQDAGGLESVGPRRSMAQRMPRGSALSSESAKLSRLKHIKETGFISPAQFRDSGLAAGGLEAIIGRVSNLLPAWFLEIGAANSKAVCLLQASGTNYEGERGSWKGTGFLVSPNILLTNHHVLNSKNVARNSACVFNFQANVDGTERETRRFRLNPDRLFITSPATGNGLDFTFVWVDGTPSDLFGTVRLDRNQFSITNRERANIISHPDGRQKTVTLQDNVVDWQNDMVVHYTSDTKPGSSGACVCNNEWKLVALHHASRRSENGELRNEGIKIAAIATWLEQMIERGENVSQASEALSLFRGSDEALGYFGSLGRGTGGTDSLEAVVNAYRGEADDIDVAFWNIEWFSKRFEDKVDAVARIIFEMNLDIWALEESSPAATERLIEVLNEDFGLSYEMKACQPNASQNVQTCTVIWNTATVECEQEEWGDPIEEWLQADSRDFDDLGLEAVEGKIFNRYPALFHFTAKNRPDDGEFDFYLIPLHLKARGEGSKRRKLASKILAAAVNKKIEEGADKDFLIGGDYNAELASGDFDALIEADLVAASAADEEDGSFTYLKRPYLSLIDHIFLSPNLASQFGNDDFFIVAADHADPRDFVREISDHRPVLMRLSLARNEASRATSSGHERIDKEALAELKNAIGLNKKKKKATA
ncbi:trypsin-like peptidase domain-containing protein [Planctomycetes bacterium K23_9]|uniref:trypsin-like peptidase domain-containing protein n=1 Tax=Stieleria marina TaxID=1930275 RepID=UPI0011A8FC84